ncbi:MAG TPA: carboxypeptidase-like regulatory domain-containing protein [Capsulimonadaceae bacterium]|jgi:hypothetical protein
MNSFCSKRIIAGVLAAALQFAAASVVAIKAVDAAPPLATPYVSNQLPAFVRARQSAATRASFVTRSVDALSTATLLSPRATTATAPIQLNSVVQTTDITLPTYLTSTNPAYPFDSTGAPNNVPTPSNVDSVWSHGEGFLVFASNRTSASDPTPTALYHLWAIKASGYDAADPGSLIQLTGIKGNPDEKKSQRWPSLLPPSDAGIAYCEASSAGGPYTLVVANLVQVTSGTTIILQVTGGASIATDLDVQHPSLSAQFVAFAGRPVGSGQKYHIYAVPTGGGARQQITSGLAEEKNPTLFPSSSGSLIAFDSTASLYTVSAAGLNGQAVGATRGVWVSSLSGAGIVRLTSPSSDSKEPTWTLDDTNSFLNATGNRHYIFFSSNRAGKYGIYFLRADAANVGAQCILDAEGQNNSGIGANTATKVDTSDPGDLYDSTQPTISKLQAYMQVAYTSNRYLVNGINDNPDPTLTNPTSIFPQSTLITGTTLVNEISSEIMTSRLFDIDPPTIMRYNEATTEIVHVENPTNPGTTAKYIQAGQQAAIVVRLSDRQSGVKAVYLQIKDPDSKYQDAAGLEHKVFTHDTYDIWSQNNGRLSTKMADPRGLGPDIATEAFNLPLAYTGAGSFNPANSRSPRAIIPAFSILGPASSSVQLTTVAVANKAADTSLVVMDASGILPGGYIQIDNGASAEYVQVTGVNLGTNTINVFPALAFVHPVGAAIYSSGAATTLRADIAKNTIGGVLPVTNAAGFRPGDTVTFAGRTTYVVQVDLTDKANTITVFDPSPVNLKTGAPIILVQSRYFFATGNEVDCQALDLSQSPFDATLTSSYITPRYLPGFDDALILSGDPTGSTVPSTVQTSWLELKPLATTTTSIVQSTATSVAVALSTGYAAGDVVLFDTGANAEYATISDVTGNVITFSVGLTKSHGQGVPFVQYKSIGGGVLYSTNDAPWTTPQVPSDYYFDVIAYDNAGWPISYDTGAGYSTSDHLNWRIFDNLGGMTTQLFVSTSGVLIVNDHALPQKFFTGRFGGASSNNVPQKYYGAESYVTDIALSYNDAPYFSNNTQNSYPPAMLPDSGYSTVESDVLSDYATPLIDGTNEFTGPFGLTYSTIIQQNHFGFFTAAGFNYPAYENGLGIGSYIEPEGGMGQIQKYDLWRILSRGPVTDKALQAYVPTVDLQPANPAVAGSTQQYALVANACVLWVSPFTGDEFVEAGSLADQTTQSLLTTYASNGGRLLVEGLDVGYSIAGSGTTVGNNFYKSVLGATYVSDAVARNNVNFDLVPKGTTSDYVTHDAFLNNNDNFDLTGNGDNIGHRGYATNNGGQNAITWIYSPPSLQKTISLANFGFRIGNGQILHADGSLAVDSSVSIFTDAYTTSGKTQLSGQQGNQLTFLGDPLANILPSASTRSGAAIAVYGSFGIENLSNEIIPTGTVTKGVGYSTMAEQSPRPPIFTSLNQRANLLHNIICMLRTGSLTGTITNTSTGGQPVAGAVVTATLETNGTFKAAVNYRAITDAAGNFLVRGLPPGRYRISADVKSNTGNTFLHASGNSVYIHGGGNGTASLQLSQPPAGSATIQVIDSVTKSPIPNAAVTVSASLTTTTADAAVGATTITVASTVGIANGTVINVDSGTAAEAVTVQSVDINTKVLTLTTGLALAHATGAVVSLKNPTPLYTGTTDQFGNFLISSIPAAIYVVTASESTYNTMTSPVTMIIPLVASPFVVELIPSAGTISGVVSDATSPSLFIVGATVSLLDANGDAVLNGSNPITATTNSLGKFSLTSVPAGTYTLQVAATNANEADSTGKVVVTNANFITSQTSITVNRKKNTAVNISLTPAPATEIDGHVYNATLPVALTTTTAATAIGATKVTVASTTGIAANDYVSIGIGVTQENVTVLGIDAGTSSITVAALKIAHPSGAAVTHLADILGATVKLTSGTVSLTAITDANGYKFKSLIAGTYTATASATGFDTQSQSVTITAGQILPNIDFRLYPAGSIAVTVKSSETGTPAVSGVVITVTGGAVTYTGTTDATGKVTIPNIRSGSYTVTAASTSGYSSAVQYNVSVTQGVSTTVALTVDPLPAQIYGTVLSSDVPAVPVANATVTFTVNGVAVRTVQTKSDGTYTTAPLGLVTNGPTLFTVTVTQSNYAAAASQKATLDRGESKELDFTLTASSTVYGLVYRNFDSQPVSGVTLTLSQGSTVIASTTSTATFTGADGQPTNFVIPGIPIGTYTLSIDAPSYSSFTPVSITASKGSNRVSLGTGLDVRHVFQTYTSTSGAFKLQMLSSPYDFTTNPAPLSSLLGGISNPLLAVYVPSLSNYVVTPTAPADTLHRGQGFWIRLKQPAGLVGIPDAQSTASPFAVALGLGWNIVGDPWPTSVHLKNISVADTRGNVYSWAQAVSAQVHLVNPVVYSYDSTAGAYVTHMVGSQAAADPTLDPYVGYWVQAYTTCSLQIKAP